MEVSRNLSFCYDIGNNCGPLSNLCHVVYATKGFSGLVKLVRTGWTSKYHNYFLNAKTGSISNVYDKYSTLTKYRYCKRLPRIDRLPIPVISAPKICDIRFWYPYNYQSGGSIYISVGLAFLHMRSNCRVYKVEHRRNSSATACIPKRFFFAGGGRHIRDCAKPSFLKKFLDFSFFKKFPV